MHAVINFIFKGFQLQQGLLCRVKIFILMCQLNSEPSKSGKYK